MKGFFFWPQSASTVSSTSEQENVVLEMNVDRSDGRLVIGRCTWRDVRDGGRTGAFLGAGVELRLGGCMWIEMKWQKKGDAR